MAQSLLHFTIWRSVYHERRDVKVPDGGCVRLAPIGSSRVMAPPPPAPGLPNRRAVSKRKDMLHTAELGEDCADGDESPARTEGPRALRTGSSASDLMGVPMRFLCLEYGEEAQVREIDDRQRLESVVQLEASAGHLLSETLESVETATTVRVRNGRLSVTDGPFAASREQLVGFHLIDAGNIEEAIRIAATIPTARVGCVEVRPIRPAPRGRHST
jgi:hypothetical protein